MFLDNFDNVITRHSPVGTPQNTFLLDDDFCRSGWWWRSVTDPFSALLDYDSARSRAARDFPYLPDAGAPTAAVGAARRARSPAYHYLLFSRGRCVGTKSATTRQRPEQYDKEDETGDAAEDDADNRTWAGTVDLVGCWYYGDGLAP